MTTAVKLRQRAQRCIPGGVSSPVRAFKYVGGTPPIFCSGKGSHISDVDGKDYIDYVGAYGPMIVGHSNDAVLQKIQSYLSKGLHFGASHELELHMAERILKHLPYLDKVRLVTSGTEACMSAIRLARAYTGKNKIIKFEGCYHGHSDSLLVSSGSGALSCGQPSSPGVLQSQAEYTLVAKYNSIDDVSRLMNQHGEDIAAIIVEPIAGNMGMIKPNPGFLKGLRDLADKFKSLLLFDEVMTGFRVSLGGCYDLYKVKPDLVMLGKVIGGGFPIGAFAGRDDIMNQLAPDGPVYQAGTLSGSPIALAAGLATLDIVEQPGFYEDLNNKSNMLISELSKTANNYGIKFHTNASGGMFGFAFSDNLPTAMPIFSDDERKLFISFFHHMLNSGINLAPSPYEAAFISSAHTYEDIANTSKAFANFCLNIADNKIS